MGLKPMFRLVANSQDITATIRDRFVSLRLTDEAGLDSDTLEVVLADHDPSARIALPPTGAELELWLGYDGQAERMGMFVVDGLELSGPPDRIVIRAKASPQDQTPAGKSSLNTSKTRPWERGTTLGAMAESIAQEHGMQAAVASSLAGIELPHVDQVSESDINLLTRLAKTYGAIAKPAGGKIVVAKRGASQSTSGRPLGPITRRRDQVTSWRMTWSKREPAGTVIATYRDLASAQDKEVTVGSGQPVKRLKKQYTTQAEATEAARASHSGRQRAEREISVTMPGDPAALAEARLVLAGGFREGVAGEWLITQAVHNLDSGGYRCSLSAETPA